MKIIIVGCGKVGGTLAKQLCSEGHDITVLDKDSNKLRAMSSGYDVLALEGDASSYNDLKEAGVETADILIAVTDSDEKNLLCCLIGRKTGNLKAIARVRNPVYNSEVEFFRKGFGLAMVINPEMAAAAEIARVFRFPSAINIETFAKGRIELLTFHLPEKSKLVGKPLTYIHSRLHTDVLVVMVRRGDEVTIPSGDFVLQAGDILSVVTGQGQAQEFFGKIGIETNRVHNVMIVGGGKVTYYLSKSLIADGINVKIIERDRERCEELSDLLPRAEIIHGDGIDEDLLLEEGIEEVEGFTALTGLDEQNIMMGLFAKNVSKSNVKLVTKITKISFDNVIAGLNLGSIVNPKEITADYILQFVRAMQASVGSEMENLYKLPDSNAEAMEFHIGEKCRACDVPLLKLRLKKNILIAKIFRGGHLFTPSGSDYMQVGDTVVLVALQKHKITNLDDILES
ncbi:MAG TPA: Trk system potassium transporter TrkA [Lachnospiraceae bacterium]|nr:Trk system potassium transporter TrkA [Lachnospiraceae bacterium]